ncbi:type II secretion system minor pseudopilin GspJ [Brevundimonas sp. 2R-24]|uniref:Type II secretion system protein J n=1 Tax=Peiella sedimenti TaxID=3061083 RepID=A0ABT8SJM8_9CAUL|nr:type II secretion system minor pseudopilin GspJ [Caulobacteraceae bacterium XZ-24]
MRSGFTLVEMLVALAIFALIAAAGVSVLGYAAASRAAVRERSDEVAELQRLRGLLSADLSQAAPRRTRGPDGAPARRVFEGGEPGGPLMRFVRAGWDNPLGEPRASLQTVEYRLVGGRLERCARPALDGAVCGSAQVLARGVRRAQVGFLYRGQWLDNFAGAPTEALPEAVRLDLETDRLGGVQQLFLAPGSAS